MNFDSKGIVVEDLGEIIPQIKGILKKEEDQQFFVFSLVGPPRNLSDDYFENLREFLLKEFKQGECAVNWCKMCEAYHITVLIHGQGGDFSKNEMLELVAEMFISSHGSSILLLEEGWWEKEFSIGISFEILPPSSHRRH